MNQQAAHGKRITATAEARRLAELARAAGLGDSPENALKGHREALALLGSNEETTLVADVLRWQGVVLRDSGRTSEAEPLFEQSLAVATRLGYAEGEAHAVNQLASLAVRRGDLRKATDLMTDALALADKCGDTRLIGMLQQNLGIVADIRGNPAAALAHYLVSIRTFEGSNDLQPLCWTLNNLGYLQLKEGLFDDARATFERALHIARARGDLMSEGILEENRAELYLTLGDTALALPCVRRALDVAERRGDDLRLAAALKLRGASERMLGQANAALDTLRAALTLSAAGEDALLGAEVLYQYGLALDASGDAPGARETWLAAADAFERISARQWVSRVHKRLTGGESGRYL